MLELAESPSAPVARVSPKLAKIREAAATPAPAPKPKAPVPPPPAELIEHRRPSMPSLTTVDLIADVQRRYSRLHERFENLAPSVAQQAVEAAEEVAVESARFYAVLGNAEVQANVIKDTLVSRCGDLEAAAADEARLAEARAKLDDAKLIELDAASQFALANAVKLLPARIKEARDRAEAALIVILETSKTHGISIAGIVDEIIAAGRSESGHVYDSRPNSWRDRGFFEV